MIAATNGVAWCSHDEVWTSGYEDCTQRECGPSTTSTTATQTTTPFDGYLMKGFAYGPMPLKEHGHIPGDDFMAEEAKPLWGRRGRGDLELMRHMGANTVRLYGNDPQHQHGSFLDEARANNIDVIPGLSDWPFIQMSGNCQDATDYNCYQQVKENYARNLQNGWLVDGEYHPALKNVIVINEPELKLGGGVRYHTEWTRGIISAIDGMIDAEREASVTGPLVNFTVPFSFAMCWTCRHARAGPKVGLSQMLQLQYAMQHPESVGYAANNDLGAFFAERFTNSFNSANTFAEIQDLFSNHYGAEFPATPYYIAEFHSWRTSNSQGQEVLDALAAARSDRLFMGVAFFEWQVRYDKGGEEMHFGMFGLGDYQVSEMTFSEGSSYPIWCLTTQQGHSSRVSIAPAVTAAFGGPLGEADFARSCAPDPEKVPFDAAGFQQIVALQDAGQKAAFVARAVQQGGGTVTDASALQTFADSVDTFEAMISGLELLPAWASWDAHAACVADRDAFPAARGAAIEQACLNGWFDCSHLPAECGGSVWDTADYIFSTYYVNQLAATGRWSCHLGGAARLRSRPADFTAADSRCIVSSDPATTALTDEGWAAVRQRGEAAIATFVGRVVVHVMDADAAPEAQLVAFARHEPAASLYDLRTALAPYEWVCGGSTGKACPEWVEEALEEEARAGPTEDDGPGANSTDDQESDREDIFFNLLSDNDRGPMWWRDLGFVALGIVVLLTGIILCCYVKVKKYTRGQAAPKGGEAAIAV